MFGVALDMKVAHFRVIWKSPWAFIVGAVAQFAVLPFFTFLLTLVIKPQPSIALGMMLVAACPGGNISNFITHLSKGDTALSVSMTALSTTMAIFFTPLNIEIWGNLNPATAPLITKVGLNPLELLLTVFFLLGLPLALGLYISEKHSKLAEKMYPPMKYFSIAVFGLFVIAALAANFRYFLDYIGLVVLVVFLHNLVAILTGYSSGRLTGLGDRRSRAVAVEVGIQNSGLGLILVFNFFGGMGGMALVAAWWGIWHIISGMALATFWSRRPPKN